MKKITYQGKEYQAYDFIMKKEHALDIISGKKTLEIRSFTPFYNKMFFDKEQDKLNKEKPEEFLVPMRTDVEFIHFRNYNNSWFLIVRIDDIGCSMMDKDDIEILAEDYNFHDYDKEWQQFEHLSDDEKPLFFWFHINEIVTHNIQP